MNFINSETLEVQNDTYHINFSLFKLKMYVFIVNALKSIGFILKPQNSESFASFGKLMVFTVRYNFGGFAWLDIFGFCSGWKGNADSGKCVGGE